MMPRMRFCIDPFMPHPLPDKILVTG